MVLSYTTIRGPIGLETSTEVSDLVRASLEDANNSNSYPPEHIGMIVANYSPNLIKERTHSKTHMASVLAYDGGKLAGTGFVRGGLFINWQFVEDPDYAFIFGVYVNPDYKKRGIGTEIYNLLMTEVLSSNKRAIQLFSNLFPGSLSFWKNKDFHEIERNPQEEVKIIEMELIL